MLDLLGVPRIRLMTNNPEKVARLEKQGVEVVERIPLALQTNPHNEQYLAKKRELTGHQLYTRCGQIPGLRENTTNYCHSYGCDFRRTDLFLSFEYKYTPFDHITATRDANRPPL